MCHATNRLTSDPSFGRIHINTGLYQPGFVSCREFRGRVAQVVEHRTFNPVAAGSSPAPFTNEYKGLRESASPFLYTATPWRKHGAPPKLYSRHFALSNIFPRHRDTKPTKMRGCVGGTPFCPPGTSANGAAVALAITSCVSESRGMLS